MYRNLWLTGPQDPLLSYRANNVAKLRKVAEQYDTDGIEQDQASRCFKISKADKTLTASQADRTGERLSVL
jgi:hypothetical protein